MIIKLANCVIEVSHIYPEVRQYCKAYLINMDDSEDPESSKELLRNQIDFSVETTAEDIAFERERSEDGRIYTDAYYELLAVYRKIAERMPAYDTFLFHGSAIAVDGQAYLFAGPSGIGKSTHVSLWRKLLQERAVMINDDKPLIRVTGKASKSGGSENVLHDHESLVFGTPWDGKHRLSSNTSAPLRAICILEQAKENRILPITKSEAFSLILQQTYRPMQPDMLRKTLSLVDQMCASVRFYHLACNMLPEAAELSWHTLSASAGSRISRETNR